MLDIAPTLNFVSPALRPFPSFRRTSRRWAAGWRPSTPRVLARCHFRSGWWIRKSDPPSRLFVQKYGCPGFLSSFRSNQFFGQWRGQSSFVTPQNNPSLRMMVLASGPVSSRPGSCRSLGAGGCSVAGKQPTHPQTFPFYPFLISSSYFKPKSGKSACFLLHNHNNIFV